MTLRDDVRYYFEREARRFPAPSSLRVDVAAAGPFDRPVSVPNFRLAAIVAVLLAVAIIAGLVATTQSRISHSVVPGRVHVGAGQLEQLVDVSPVDGAHAWALILLCSSDLSKCQAWVESSSDGGRTWGGAVKVGPDFAAENGDTPRHIFFTSAADGFVYGLGIAYVTHDSGKTWKQMPEDFTNLLWIDGSATIWELLDPCPPGTRCVIGVRSSSDAGRTWSAAAPLPAGLDPQQLLPFGSSGLLLGGSGKGNMAITTDGGRTWRSIAGRCDPENPRNSVATPDGVEIWQVCGPRTLGVNVSEDGGAHWTARQNPAIGYLVGAAIVSPSAGTALLTTSTTTAGVIPELLVTHDRGASWQLVPAARGFSPPFFTPDGEAWAADLNGYVWVSTDDGLTWVKRSQP